MCLIHFSTIEFESPSVDANCNKIALGRIPSLGVFIALETERNWNTFNKKSCAS